MLTSLAKSRAQSTALRSLTRRAATGKNPLMAPAARRSNSSLPQGYVEDKSKGPMLRFQESLPRLPVPTLEETAARYVKSIHPLLSPVEFAASKKAVDEFIKPGGAGEKLQNKLIAKREDPKTKNWIYEWWNDAAYLSYRDPVVPYSPAAAADHPVKFDPKDHKHIIAIRKNQFFKIAHEADGQQLNTTELEAQFAKVYELAQRVPAVGALTSENRDVWTDARKVLLDASPKNAAVLEAIESASFIVCLDDASPVTLEERAHQYWHGDGQNRWYDKPLQFIVNDNGTSGFMGEHSMMDGTPTHRLNDYVNDAVFGNKLDFSNPSVRSNLPDPVAVNFEITPEVRAEIDRATKDFATVIGQHELAVQAYQGYGKGLIKKFKCSPDAYVQMIIQLAYYKMYGKNRPTYESAATRRFQLGRTETCRTVSDDSVAFCNAVADPSVSDEDRVALFRKATAAHIEYISAASDGKGVDRHLFGLKKLLEPGEDVPAIYKDPAFGYSSSWFLSTSQLSSEFFNGYGWSQVIDAGFGIAYMINENSLNFNIVSKGLGSQKMSYYLNEAAGDIRDLLLPTLEAPKAKL
ncbi:hypothetical protein CIB48_g4669 [Xylaria polymorpha]|nr:hypothetical protein CIB48_g4669 [Xylaria polymorpha]